MRFFRNWEAALRKLEMLDPIVIAAIHSHCIGGGLQIALACDLRIARADARFGITAVKEGIIPGIGMWRVARYAGLGRAKRLALTADVIDALTAHAWGLVDWVVEEAAFETRIEDLTGRMLAMAPTSTRLTKKLTNMAFETSFADFVETYFEYQRQSTTSTEHLEAMARAPRRPRRGGRPGSKTRAPLGAKRATFGVNVTSNGVWQLDIADVRRLYRQAKADRWSVPLDAFATSLALSARHAFAGNHPAPAQLARYLDSLHLEDLALACACAEGIDTAWDHFVSTYRPGLYRAADAIDPSGGAREAADALYAELFGLTVRDGTRQSHFRYFHGRSSLATWLRAVLSQRYVDHIRSHARFEPLPADEGTDAIAASAAPGPASVLRRYVDLAEPSTGRGRSPPCRPGTGCACSVTTRKT